MDEFNQRKLFQNIDRRVLLVVASGIVLSVLFFTLALARRPGGQSKLSGSLVLNIHKNLGFTVLKGFSGSDSRAPINAPISSELNCTNTVRYWIEKPKDWPTDNLVVGQFTFRKDTILTIFQAEAQDEVTRVQQQFLAAALNILQGANPGKIDATMAESSAWLNDHPAKVDLTEQERVQGAELADRLANFNRGLAGPGACPGNPSEPALTAIFPPIVLPPSPSLGSSTSPLSMGGEASQEKQKPRRRRESQPEPASPTAPAPELSQPIPAVAPTNPPTAEVAPTPQVASSEPVVSSPGPSQNPSQPAYNPPAQAPAAPQTETKKPKEKKNPKHPSNEQPSSSPAPSQPAGQPAPPPEIGSGEPAGSSNPGNLGNDPGNGNGNDNGNGNNNGNGNGNGNGGGNEHGNGRGNGKGDGNGKGHGKKP